MVIPLSDDAMRVRLSGPADVAAAIPHIVGFHPEESLVVISLSGPRRRIGLTMRFDLPPASLHAVMADEVAIRLQSDGAGHAFVACCTTQAGDDARLPRADLVAMIDQRLRDREITLMEALLIRDRRWWSYLCDDAECCPPCGTEMREATDIAAAHALIGRAVLPDREALAEQLRPVASVARAAMTRALKRAGAAPPTPDETVSLAVELLDRYAEPANARLSDNEAARLIVGLSDVHARDGVIVAAVRHDLDTAQRLFIELCRRALPPQDAPTCTTLAWLAYADGNGALANVALERAFASRPDYSLARLLRDGLHGQIPPALLRKAWLDRAAAAKNRRRLRGAH
jgi:hypothetical protein